MNKCAKSLFVLFLLISCNAYATTGLSALEGLWILYLVLGLIVFALIILGIFWLKITWVYLIKNECNFYKLKSYMALTVVISTVSGLSAFFFHQNAPYSQNVYFLSVAILILTVSIISIIVQFNKLKKTNDST